MQHRMKTHMMTKEKIEYLLNRTTTCSIATLNADGTPYVTPMHHIFHNGYIYMHGLPKGTKIDNIKANPRVSITAYEMDSLLLDPKGNACDTNTKYQSVIISGVAAIITEVDYKREILMEIVKKYTPQLSDTVLPENMVAGTAVIKVQILDITGKYYG
ncbi:pyridoxamine 5'-phosphate oxidase-related FMN-binding protein [Ruminiclostridium papyrosolvens DSM 2782]|uniref:Pyridoxamine 5'-phosphate oxidase-related FMN-binding protein n=1 Tax=Ruminiclostridium papyrosolvens DSM 2782 TaxID=588581 RepID=F1T8A9_9FIRM|nr:pyridoxamine 5'-phosphate oxidase family protein [Ruminiclostridium papyrosolvens]EGD49707.1 pyridoxamine 5'-phosphate oxidase-related FMN-binding protein [Ruminiclostridium papyrosolvens DSM 2782]WES33165.1 pyridoxamine 5'-phosphate oxidase family protein [Ruminiclostridium papyrosolvens DSM 2782]